MVERWSLPQANVDRAEMLRFLGYRRGAPVSPDVLALVERAESLGGDLVRPQGLSLTLPLEVSVPQRVLRLGAPGSEAGEGIHLVSGQLARHCQGCERLSLLACTIGAVLEVEVSRLFAQGELALATTLDAFGSAAAEGLAAEVDQAIGRRGRDAGYQVTRRFSPGYGDWDLAVQGDLLKLLGAGTIGMRVTESHMLYPQKSVTAVVGWRRAE